MSKSLRLAAHESGATHRNQSSPVARSLHGRNLVSCGKFIRCSFVGALLFWGAPAHAQEGTAPANQPDAPANSTPDESAPATNPDAQDAPKTGLTLGADLFYGASNLPGAHRFRDGFWIGAGPLYPSNLYGIYRGEDGLNAKVAVSLGKQYNGSVEGFDQPVEAYVSKNYRGTDLTIGKFYVPFELLEWQYETEYGVQAARDFGRSGSLTVALTRNRRRNALNAYARFARTFGIATLGISLGGGRGFSYDTDHDKGAALDLTLEKGRLRFESSVIAAQQNGAASRFGFIFARLNYQLTPKTELYLSRHSWSDRLEQQGNGHFSTLGAVFHLNDHLAVEGALSRSGEQPRNVRWIQLHYTVER